MTNPRARLKQERSRQRREELLDAAVALFAEGGTRSVTHRSVARRAGLPAATPAYYFSSIDALVNAALMRYVDSWIANLSVFMELELSAENLADVGKLQKQLSKIHLQRPPEVASQDLHVLIHCQRDPQLLPVALHAVSSLENAIQVAFERHDVDGAEELARITTAAVLGSGLRRAMRMHPPSVETRSVAASIYYFANGENLPPHVTPDS